MVILFQMYQIYLVMIMQVLKAPGSNPAAVYWLLGLSATGVLQPDHKLRGKLALHMTALPLTHLYFSVYGKR